MSEWGSDCLLNSTILYCTLPIVCSSSMQGVTKNTILCINLLLWNILSPHPFKRGLTLLCKLTTIPNRNNTHSPISVFYGFKVFGSKSFYKWAKCKVPIGNCGQIGLVLYYFYKLKVNYTLMKTECQIKKGSLSPVFLWTRFWLTWWQ